MTTPRELDVRAVGLILLLAALWGGNTVAIKLGLADAPPLALGWMRFVLGGLCVLGWGWWTRAPFTLRPGELWPLLGLGLLFAVQLGTLNIGTWLSTAGHAVVILNAYPVHIVVIAHFLVPGDRMTLGKLGGVLLGYGGVILLFADQRSAVRLSDSTIVAGDLVLALSALLLGLRQVVLNRQLQFIHPVKPLLAQVVIGTPLFVALSAWFEPEPIRWTPGLAGSLFYQGFLIAGFNFIANMWVLQHYRPSAVAAFSLTTPLFGVLATALILHEPITWTLGVSALLVAGGIAAATLIRPPSGRAATTAPAARPDEAAS
ncbi:MAG TPA: DMT family transporter [Methylomirabilota bacterium]|nr:DMT family transporter [Methylomirabilota bacterium]